MIHDELVTYEVAKLAKEEGFNAKCYHYYQRGELQSDGCFNRYNKGVDSICSAPTQSLLQRWLREEKIVNISIDSEEDFGGENLIYEWQASHKKYIADGSFILNTVSDMEFYSTYEKALEYALKYALENLT